MGKKIIWTVQKKLNSQYNVRCLKKPYGINIAKRKERVKHSNFYKNVYGADIKQRLKDIGKNGEKNSLMVRDLLIVFFSFTKRLPLHDTYQVVVILFCSYLIVDVQECDFW